MTSNTNEEKLDWNCVLCLFEKIEQMYSKKPSKREKQIYESWKKEINEYIYHCNKLCKFKIYEILK